jgi:hypothetical protein
MALPLLASGGGDVLVDRLRRSGVAASQFREVSPELADEPGSHDVAMKFYQQLVWIPTHHSLNSRQMDQIGERVALAAARTTVVTLD